MPISMNLPLLAVSLAPRKHSHKLIEETKEFVINTPTMEFVKEILFCGRRSGRDFDKFKETKFTPLPAKTVRTNHQKMRSAFGMQTFRADNRRRPLPVHRRNPSRVRRRKRLHGQIRFGKNEANFPRWRQRIHSASSGSCYATT